MPTTTTALLDGSNDTPLLRLVCHSLAAEITIIAVPVGIGDPTASHLLEPEDGFDEVWYGSIVERERSATLRMMPVPLSPVLSCVVDTHPRFQLELLRWFATATECAGVPSEHLVVHAIRPGGGDVLRFVQRAGVRVVTIDPFDARSPHCNKISGALALAESLAGTDSPVALMDTDMLVMADPTVLAPAAGDLYGKRVDLANPPLDSLCAIFRHAHLPLPEALPAPQPTLRGNFNGGLYVCRGGDLKGFARAWATWAHWLLDRPALLSDFAIHVDQIAACLAGVDLGLNVRLVDLAWNLPSHLPDLISSQVDAPKLIHYHRCVDDAGKVEHSGNPVVDESIDRANAVVERMMKRLRHSD